MTREEALYELKNAFRYGIDDRLQEAIDMAIKSLNDEQKWIPCDGKLPRGIGHHVLVTIKWNDGDQEVCEMCPTNADGYNIIAFQPLPTPYKAEPKSKVDDTENPKCDKCIYKIMWKEQEKGNVLPEYAEWIEEYNKMVDVNSDEWIEKTDKEFTKMWNENILCRLQERFEEEERKAFAKPHGLKEHAVWNKAIKILEEYMQE